MAVFCAVGRIDAVQERGQRSRLEGRSVAFGQFVDQGADPHAAEGAVGVVDRGYHRALAASKRAFGNNASGSHLATDCGIFRR
ncbi:hypothetical protein AB0E27_42235 [Streptomyces sparsogenes]|uniref:hypothetical protein n=1 Tax=Streptomyces sparsogenes TaxID=67365 RepID=UPI0033D91641